MPALAAAAILCSATERPRRHTVLPFVCESLTRVDLACATAAKRATIKRAADT